MNFADFVPFIIIGVIVIAVVLYAVVLNRGINRSGSEGTNELMDERRRNIRASKVTSFMPPKIMNFFNVLQSAMPSNYVLIPNVAVELLFKRVMRRDLRLQGQYVDVCVFTPNFVPVLVINLNDFSRVADSTFDLPENVKSMLRSSGIPVMDYDMRDSYSIDDLRRTIAKSMNPLL